MKRSWNALFLSASLILVPTAAWSESVKERSPLTCSSRVENQNGQTSSQDEDTSLVEGETDQPSNQDSKQPESVAKDETAPETPEAEDPTDQPSNQDSDQPESVAKDKTAPETLQQRINKLLPALSQQECNYLTTLIKADQRYKAGKKEKAKQLYQQAKASFQPDENQSSRKPYTDTTELPPGGKVYWEHGQAEFDSKLRTKSLSPLKLLVEKHPAFIPGHLRYAEALINFDQTEKAITHLERVVSRYPQQPRLVEALLPLYQEQEQWLDASLTARRFALLNPDHSKADEYQTLADKHLENYKSQLRAELRRNTFASIITGALSFAVTGGLAGPFSALESASLLLQGESKVGERISNNLQEQLPLLEDSEVNQYVAEMGQTLTQYTGRDSFDYDFHIVMDENLNAFALPGGKVFINAGAILKTNSEAELAGLVAHEISHAVLSHGFQLVTEGNFLANVGQFVPLGGTAASLIVLDYSRDMERQADELGTQILASSEYAADGLYHLMETLAEERKKKDQSSPPAWLSTHPEIEERINNIKTQIVDHGYDRYTYEGVSQHQAIKEKVANLLAKHQAEEEKEKEGDEDETD